MYTSDGRLGRPLRPWRRIAQRWHVSRPRARPGSASAKWLAPERDVSAGTLVGHIHYTIYYTIYLYIRRCLYTGHTLYMQTGPCFQPCECPNKMCIHTYVYIYIVYIYIHIHACVCVCQYKLINKYVCIYIYTDICITSMYIYIYMYVRTYMYIYICVSIYMYTSIFYVYMHQRCSGGIGELQVYSN